jgi:hypothetical protein
MTIRSDNAMASLIARVTELEERLRLLECLVEWQGEEEDDKEGPGESGRLPQEVEVRRGPGRPRKVRY